MKKLINESGLRNIGELAKRYQKAKIYFHQDLDGVTTAIAMKNYLEDNGIKVVDVEVIQYGEKEFAVKKIDAEGDTMPVLVDFAHGKPMFVVHTDHHDSQKGVEKDTAVSFRPSRSNVATISQVLSPKEIFPIDDITLISTVDSADFARFGLQPDDIMNFIFRLSKDKTLQQNKMALGLATNKLLLAFKGRENFLEELVMTSKPSLLNIFQNINKIAKRENLSFQERLEKGLEMNKWGKPKNKPYASPEEMTANQQEYIRKQAESDKVIYDEGIIVQYGGGSLFKPGSYDRYTPFKNYPEADFLVIAWPLGLVQASCNPFKGERELKGVNLGEIAQEVLSKWEGQLKEKLIPLSTIKWISESGKEFGEESVGFTNADLEAFYGDKMSSIEGGEEYMNKLKTLMDKPYNTLTEQEWEILDKMGVPAWEMIQANSGGHKCITNISALNYFGRSKRPPQGKYSYDSEREDSPYIKFIKMIQQRFVEVLKQKISESKTIKESASKLRSNLPAGVTEKGNELSNGGEISGRLADLSIELFNKLNDAGVKSIKITSGNDKYHQGLSYNSKHKEGNALDFTVPNYSQQKSTIIDVLNKMANEYSDFKYIDEYANPSKKSTGGHFHIQIGGQASTKSTDKTGESNVLNTISNTVDNVMSKVKGGVFDKISNLTVKNPFQKVNEEKTAELVEPDKEDFFFELENFQGTIEQSNKENMSYKKTVETFQIGLELLGYPLPNFGVDGRFGPETAKALNKFKQDKDIKIPKGNAIFDEETSKTMVVELQKKGIDKVDIEQYILPRKEFKTEDGTIKHNYSGEKAKNIELLIQVMNEMGITDASSQIGILAVIGKESNFIPQKETSYEDTSNSRIRSIFSKTKNLSDDELTKLKSNYNKFFDYVYGGILGNDNPGDGSKYVGRGFNQITGKSNYRSYSQKVGMDLVNNPDLLLEPKVAAEAAIKFLTKGKAQEFDNPNDAAIHYADVNAGGSPSRRARETTMRELNNFDLV